MERKYLQECNRASFLRGNQGRAGSQISNIDSRYLTTQTT